MVLDLDYLDLTPRTVSQSFNLGRSHLRRSAETCSFNWGPIWAMLRSTLWRVGGGRKGRLSGV